MNLTMKGGKVDQKTEQFYVPGTIQFCYKTGEVRDWIKVSKPAKFLMKP